MQALGLICCVLHHQLLNFKMAIARDFLETLLQKGLNQINDDLVKCGCPSCINFDGCNYPTDEGQERLENNAWGPTEGPVNRVPIGECLLYEWFRLKCVEFELPLLRAEIDHPQLWPLYLNLTECLGLGTALSTEESWNSRIRALSYSQQINTLYKMLYSLDHPDNQTFEVWFTYRGHSLFP
jgi:hypothetical protein